MNRILSLVTLVLLLTACHNSPTSEEKEEYDNPMERGLLEAEKMKDPALGYVPYERLYDALTYTTALKQSNRSTSSLTWVERGPIYDSVGPSNGNRRGGGASPTGAYTAGRMRAFLLDTLNDPTGNTALAGGVAGGLWRCTNFLSAIPNWTPVNDFFDNLAVASVCQHPTNPSIIYFATGEATSNSDAVFGKGVWKSTDGGLSFSLLPATAAFTRNFKIACDAAGNVYLATRSNGIVRSNDNGTTWTNITPNNLTSGNGCTDFEFTASGKLNAAFGYFGTLVNHRYTNNPATVTSTGWSAGSGFRTSNTQAIRTELAVLGETLYAVTVNSARNADSCYKSLDGGQTWTLQNTSIMPTALSNTQGWYNLTLAINPTNEAELICAGLDAYRSTNNGTTWSRLTFWVSTSPYVHADHHYLAYWMRNGETRLIMGGDGGLYYSTNNGATFVDKNRNLAIKQFYSVAIHPAAGSPYVLAGAQDNGTHQLKNPGLSYSIEVTGGDGMFVHINQQNPQIQFGSYVYNQYRRSTNGGATWSSVNLSTSGLFVNPFDYDDANNIMYSSNGGNGQIRRWDNANSSSTSSVFSIAAVGGTTALSSFHVSPHTANRVFFGTNSGRVFRLNNAATVTAGDIDANVANISGASFPTGYVSCVNSGTDDNNLVAVFSNYGISNVWVTTNGGTSWTAIDGNLPDMPVRWALYDPGRNDRLYLATEAGVYHTDLINGTSTIWTPEVGFPTVRTDMLKMRRSDSTIAAGTHGRGVFTAKIEGGCSGVSINSQPQNTTVCAGSNATFTVAVSGTAPSYQWQVSTNGGSTFTNITGQTTATLTLTAVTAGMNNHQYRCVIGGGCTSSFNSNAAILSVSNSSAIANQPANTITCAGSNASFSVTATGASLSYQWERSTDNGISFTAITGATSTVLNLTTVTAAMNNSRYRCIVSSSCAVPLTSNAGILTVNTSPTVTAAPQDAAVCAGANNVFSVTAAGTAVTYQWQLSTDGGFTYNNIAGAFANTLNVTGITPLFNGNRYRCIVSGTCAPAATSNPAILSVLNPAAVSLQPQASTICAGNNTSFTTAATGSGITYQWQVSTNGGTTFTNISGANQATYNVVAASMTLNSNLYRCIINGDCNTVNSNTALLRVNALPTVITSTTPFMNLFPGLTTKVTATVTSAVPVNYVWYKNNVLIPGATGNSLTVNIDGLGDYKTVVTDANGCIATSGIIKIADSVSNKMFVYPNPSAGLFQVRYYAGISNFSARTISVYDAKGAVVFRKNYTITSPYEQMQVNMNGYGRGVYFVELSDNNGKRIASARVLVQ